MPKRKRKFVSYCDMSEQRKRITLLSDRVSCLTLRVGDMDTAFSNSYKRNNLKFQLMKDKIKYLEDKIDKIVNGD